MVIEEEVIDQMSHENNTQLTLKAGRWLDEAVKVARSYPESKPDTPLIVESDHETGDLAVEGTDPAGPEESDGSFAVDGPFRVTGTDRSFSLGWTTKGYSSLPVPVTAEGPGPRTILGSTRTRMAIT